jgi:hypothetical protein
MDANAQSLCSIGRRSRLTILLIATALAWSAIPAQTQKTITIRLFDGKSGLAIAPIAGDAGINVPINQGNAGSHLTAHANKDGVWELSVTPDVETLQIDSPSGPDGWGYVSCDGRLYPTAQPIYSVADILKSGIVSANHCNKKIAAPLAKAGEIVLYVRRPNWMEKIPH